MIRAIAWLIFLSLACTFSPLAGAVQVPGYVTTVWRAQQGAPQDISVVAQADDGWIWLGTPGGLFRFDGRTFARHDLIPADYRGSRQVTDATTESGGGLWVIYGRATAIHLAGDGRTVSTPPGLPDEGVGAVFEDGDGRTFASVNSDIYVLNNGRWMRCMAPVWSLPPSPIEDVTVDDRGDIVATTEEHGAYRLARGSSRFLPVSESIPHGARFFEGADGRLWASSSRKFDLINGVTVPHGATPHGVSAMDVVDGHGGFWTVAHRCPTTCARSAGFTPDIPRLDETTEGFVLVPVGADGLTIMTLLTDAEGDVWGGAKEGLVRFHPDGTKRLDLGEKALYFAVTPLQDRHVLLATDSHGDADVVFLATSAGLTPVNEELPTTASTRLADGSVVLGGHAGLTRFARGRFEALSSRPRELGQEPVQVLLPADGSRLWVGVRDRGLFLVDGDHWQPMGRIAGFPDSSPLAGAVDGTGQAWFGLADGTVVNVAALAVRPPVSHQTGLGSVTAILPGLPLLAGGELGVAWFDGKTFHPLRLRQEGLLRGVTGLARTADGALWANSRLGLVRIAADELVAAYAGKPDVAFRIFDDSDGMPGGAQQIRPLPTLNVDATGSLWVAGTRGLAVVDPVNVRERSITRPAVVSVKNAQGTSMLSEGGVLEPGKRSLEIGFTGLSLGDPMHVELRYRLRGADAGWQAGEGSNLVTYADLGPGTYQFEVQSRGTEGDWSPSALSPVVRAKPAFVETPAFHGLIGSFAAALVFVGHRLRVRSLRRHQTQRIEAKLKERDRIARELHDSMLQGMTGIALKVSAWQGDERAPADMRTGLGNASSQLMALVLEGRARVIALRGMGIEHMALSETLGLIGDDHADSSNASFELTVAGTEVVLADALHLAILDILREAIHNAYVHAAPSNVWVLLDFSRGGLLATVRDDGSGFPAKVAERGHRAGHWGLVTMRERATEVGAEISIRSSAGGTELTLLVPPDALRVLDMEKRWFGRFRTNP